jgi:hypothetical protein
MSEQIENKVDLEDMARLSMWLGFQYFKTMNDAFRKDTDRCSTECQNLATTARSDQITSEAYSELEFWYRNLARSFMSYVDGILYVMRRLIIFSHKRRASFPSYGRMTRFLPTRLRRMMEKMS